MCLNTYTSAYPAHARLQLERDLRDVQTNLRRKEQTFEVQMNEVSRGHRTLDDREEWKEEEPIEGVQCGHAPPRRQSAWSHLLAQFNVTFD